MADVKKGGIVAAKQNAANGNNGGAVVAQAKNKSVAYVMNELIDSEGIKGRINELLGKRAPQFVGSLVSLVNADENMKKVFKQAPLTIIQAGLRAATYDLPIDPGLGYAYILPFRNEKKGNILEAQFVMGYKGMYQLAMRSGVYKKLNVVDIREGELKGFNRLTEDFEIEFIEDEDERNKLPIVGYCGFFRLVNGMEKVLYMSKKAIYAHEKAHRKGQQMGFDWKKWPEAMELKTVLRKLIGKWGIMSIAYQTADPAVLRAAEAIAKGQFDDEDIEDFDAAAETTPTVETTAETVEVATKNLADGRSVDTQTGELFEDGEFTADDIKSVENENTEA